MITKKDLRYPLSSSNKYLRRLFIILIYIPILILSIIEGIVNSVIYLKEDW